LNVVVEGYPATYEKPWRASGVRFMPPCNMKSDAYIVNLVSKYHKAVTGTDCVVGTLPDQMPGNDSGHLFNAGVQAITYGPRGKPSPDGSADQNVLVNDILTCTKVYALTAIEVCMGKK